MAICVFAGINCSTVLFGRFSVLCLHVFGLTRSFNSAFSVLFLAVFPIVFTGIICSLGIGSAVMVLSASHMANDESVVFSFPSFRNSVCIFFLDVSYACV